MTAHTISADDLFDRARAAHADIELPGPEGGWAVAVINGREYRARVGAALRVGEVRCPKCGMGATPNSRGFRSHVDPDGRLCPNRDFTEETP